VVVGEPGDQVAQADRLVDELGVSRQQQGRDRLPELVLAELFREGAQPLALPADALP